MRYLPLVPLDKTTTSNFDPPRDRSAEEEEESIVTTAPPDYLHQDLGNTNTTPEVSHLAFNKKIIWPSMFLMSLYIQIYNNAVMLSHNVLKTSFLCIVLTF